MTFNVYGSVFATYSPLNLFVINSVLVNDYLVNGFYISAECTSRSNNALYGEIVFNNYTQRGNSYMKNSAPIQILTLNNVTINNANLLTYNKMTDSFRNQMSIDTSYTCQVPSTDKAFKFLNVTNIYMTINTTY